VIHAKDPATPPVWDLSASNVEAAPGSYTRAIRGRGCWQFSGAENIQIADIVITGCHNAGFNSAGVRYYEASKGIKLSNVVFRDNDNGLTGGSQDSEITVEFLRVRRQRQLERLNQLALAQHLYLWRHLHASLLVRTRSHPRAELSHSSPRCCDRVQLVFASQVVCG